MTSHDTSTASSQDDGRVSPVSHMMVNHVEDGNPRKNCYICEEDGEPLHEACERLKLLLSQCPHHEFTLVSREQLFYDGLLGLTQAIVDNACGGAMREKMAEEVLEIYGMLGQNSQQRSSRGEDKE
ncbi:hypothetical protein Ddye_021990 [Dipteronia dyeriana]|uniref:Uncharacterized protein n=1 Tax=Dipteronia dyeriana TaxID=168575 RepID=A0AAD9U3Q5_9ROSI|nr:hypothetical protein Ddye_021990 [Dipteronia dyeriana]